MASLSDLERREEHRSQTALPLRAAAQFCALFPETLSFETDPFSSPSQPRQSLSWVYGGPGPHTVQPAAQVAGSAEGARELKDGVPSGQPSILRPSV